MRQAAKDGALALMERVFRQGVSPTGKPGINVNAKDKSGETALHIAASHQNRTGMVRRLLEKGADIHAKNSRDETALHIVVAADGGNVPPHGKSSHWFKKDLEVVKLLLKNGARLDTKNNKGQTVLHRAVFSQHIGSDMHYHEDIIKHLLQQDGLDVNAQDTTGGKAVLHSIVLGDVDIFELLLKHEGLDLNVQDTRGFTPLYHAASFGGSSKVLTNIKRLLEEGADLHRPSNGGFTPLHIAAHNNRTDVISLLLEHGVRVNLKDKNGKTALQVARPADGDAATALQNYIQKMPARFWQAAQSGDLTLFNLLIHDVEVSEKSQDGQTVLHFAAIGGHLPIWHRLRRHIHSHLLDPDGKLVNTQDTSGRTALHLASHHGHEDLAPYIISAKTDTTLQDSNGQIALHLAAAAGHTETVRALLDIPDDDLYRPEYRADITFQDDNDQTALHLAAFHAQLDMVKLLVKSGASVFARDTSGNTPYYYAQRHAHLEDWAAIAAFLTQQEQQGWQEWWQAARAGNVARVEALLAAGIDVNVADANGWTALHFAADYGHLGVVNALLKVAALEVNRQEGQAGETALHLAVFNGDEAIVAALLSHADIDLTIQDDWQYTVLHTAVENEDVAVFNWLRVHLISNHHLTEVRAYLNTPTDRGRTALHLAAELNLAWVVQKLLDAGADHTLPDDAGQTPLEVAEAAGAMAALAAFHGDSLHRAAAAGATATVMSLLEAGADVYALTTRGHTAQEVATLGGHPATAAALATYIAEMPAQLRQAAQAGDAALVRRLLDNGVDVNAQNGDGWTALHYAAEYGQQEIVTLLLAHADIDVNVHPEAGETPLQAAAYQDALSIVKALLDAGAGLHLPEDGWTALHYAVENEHLALVEALLGLFDEHGAAPAADQGTISRADYLDALNDEGNTVLHIAVTWDLAAIATVLLAHGADTTVLNEAGQTPLEVAEAAGSTATLAVLQASGNVGSVN